MKKTVLIVDDNQINRAMLRGILGGGYELLEAENGKEAIAVMERCPEGLSAVLLDLIMPEMDGFQVLSHIREDSRLSPIPVLVVTASTDREAELRALSLGAVDFITKPFIPELILRRLANLIRLREASAMASAAQHDGLTGLYTRTAFFSAAAEMISARGEGYFVLASLDVDSFKVINDQYGNSKGDQLLRHIADTLKKRLSPSDGIACRVESDNFAVLYPRQVLSSGEMDRIRRQAAALDGSIAPVTISTGRYIVSDKSLDVSAMYDRAVLAKNTVKGRFDSHEATYDESMRDRLLREQEIIGSMNEALKTGQFLVYFQPQYNHSTGALIGAEALVRWLHPQKGLIPPGSFIPVFERNGFVYEVDKYVWEHTCALLRRWLDQGRAPLPVSVNISRYDVFRPDLIDVITGLTEKYRVPVELLRLEITESAFAGDISHIVNVVRRLIGLGFTVEIDDFGSAYSSLNTLKDVPAQILKLDMHFLEGGSISGRGGNVLESIVRMARWLGMSVIAEGVETKAQADFMESVGCSYIQGYYYARPMPEEEFEALSERARREEKILRLETVTALDSSAFWDPDSLDTLVFNCLVGGACIFEYSDGKAELLRANEKFSHVVGGDELTLEQALKLVPGDLMDPESLKKVRRACQAAIDTGDETSCEVVLLSVTEKRRRVCLRLTLRVIARVGKRCLFYCINEDMTEQREAEENEHMIYMQMRTITHNMHGAVTATVFDETGGRFIFTNDQYYSLLGYTKQQYQAEVTDMFRPIHPQDRERVARMVRHSNATGQPCAVEYRVIRRDGAMMWFHSNISMVRFPGVDSLVQLAVANDITAERNTESERRHLTDQMQKIMDNVGSGITASVLKSNQVRLLFANNRFYDLFGYTREQYSKEVSDSFDLIHPDDRQAVADGTKRATDTGESMTLTYRALRRDGSRIWLRSVLSVTDFEDVGAPVEICIFSDVSAEKESELRLSESAEQLRFLNDSARDLFSQADANRAIDALLRQILDYFGGDRAYVIESDDLRQVTSNSYEVCAPGAASQKDKLMDLPFSVSPFWFSAFDRDKYISIPDVSALDDSRAQERDILRQQGISSLVAVPLLRENQLIGFVGVDDPRRQLAHVRNLQAIGDYITALLSKRDLDAKVDADRQMLRNMMDDTPGGFVRLRVLPKGRLSTEYVNETFCRIRGMTREQILARDGADAMGSVHPEDLPSVLGAVGSMIATGKTWSLRYRVLRADGSYVPLSVFARMTRDGDGVRHINAYLADLSEQEKNELSVDETIPYVLSTILSSSPDIAFAKDASFRYICCSTPCAKLVGLDDPSEIIGKTDYDLYPKSIADQIRRDDQRLLDSVSPSVNFIESVTTRDGGLCYLNMSKYIMFDSLGNIIGLCGTGRDITEERDAYARLKLLTNSLPGGIATYVCSSDSSIRIIYFNDTFCQMMGYTREEYSAIAADSAVSLVFKEDLKIVEQQLFSLLHSDAPVDCRYRIHKKDGGYIWVNLRGELSERHGDTAVINTVLYDITARVDSEAELRLSEESFRIAAQMGGRDIARYDIKTGEYYHENPLLLSLGMGSKIKNVPQSLLDRGLIAPECTKDCLDFFSRLKGGEPSCTVDYAQLAPGGGYGWVRAEATVIFDTDGAPSHAIIATEDISELREQEASLLRLRQSLQQKPGDSYTFFRWNLSRELLVLSVEGGLLKPRQQPGDATLNAWAKKYAESSLLPEDRSGFLALVNSRGLLDSFRQKKQLATLEYRELGPEGAVAWRQIVVELVKYANSSDIEAYLTIEDIDQRKTLELQTLAMAETDPLTGILNRGAFEKKISRLLKDDPSGSGALLMLDIDGFKQINDTFGHTHGDKALIGVASALRSVLRDTDLLGRLGGDEFIVCLTRVSGRSAIEKKARQICQRMHGAFPGSIRLSVSVGIAMYPRNGADFESLYHRADTALYTVKNSGKDGFAFYSEE